MFKKFLDEKIVTKIVEDLLSDKISSRECWEKLCDSATGINSVELDKFILSQKVEPTLHKFIEFCEEKKFDVFILSDGFDYYIERILKKEHLQRINYFSNNLKLYPAAVSNAFCLSPNSPFR